MFDYQSPGGAVVSGKCQQQAPGTVVRSRRPGGGAVATRAAAERPLAGRRPLRVPRGWRRPRVCVPPASPADVDGRPGPKMAAFGWLATPGAVTAFFGRLQAVVRGCAMAAQMECKWFTVGEVAAMLQFGVSKTKQLVSGGEIRSVKIGGSRRILPEWVDEFVAESVVRGER